MLGITKLGTTNTPQTEPVVDSVNKVIKYKEWEKDPAGNEKAEVLILSNDGETARTAAGETARHANIVETLVRARANLIIKDSNGWTAGPR